MAINFKRTKKGFNGMDLFIILVLALIIAAAVFVLRGFSRTGAGAEESNKRDVELTLEFRKLSGSVIGYIKEGDHVKDPNTKQDIGIVVSVQSVPYSEIAYNHNDGSVYMAENPDLYDLLITLRTDAAVTDKGYHTGGTNFLVGKSCSVWSQGFAGTGYCISIREMD
ncbi:MAG: DUF4330 domain-containing protein [Clostridia bacterium]|nr:DUF4330 domain-containing protein [Clostridia bacterium]